VLKRLQANINKRFVRGLTSAVRCLSLILEVYPN